MWDDPGSPYLDEAAVSALSCVRPQRLLEHTDRSVLKA
jgi:hypothetical protein